MMMMMSTVVATAVVTGIMAGVSDGGGVWRRWCMAEVVYGGGGVWRRWCLGTKPQPDQAEPIERTTFGVRRKIKFSLAGKVFRRRLPGILCGEAWTRVVGGLRVGI
ncbi:hypothetical protein Tco_1014504 [Tanacetum coccineum]